MLNLNFVIGSTGDLGSYSIQNVIDGKTDSYWVSEQPETDTFHPSIFINFTSQTLFEAFTYKTAYRYFKDDSIYHFDGFPSKLKVYTALTDNDPFVLKAVFTGQNMDTTDSIQFTLSKPILCTRVKLEFHDVSIAYAFNLEEKHASVSDLVLYKGFEYTLVGFKETTGDYKDSNYINIHKITDFKSEANSERKDNPFTNALDEDGNSKWVSEKEESNDFTPTIYLNFTNPINFDGLIYSVTSHEEGSLFNKHRVYDGFPERLIIYTALNDEEDFSLYTVFAGKIDKTEVQFRLLNPVKCTRVKIELHEVTNHNGEGKFAASDRLVFLQAFDYEELNYQKVSGDYEDSNYVDFHNIPKEIIKVTTNGDYTDHQIDKALDTNGDTYWQSEQPESENFHPTIFVNFTEPTLFEALIYDVKSDKGPPRKYFGFPEKMLIYTALGDDEPFTLRYTFQGSPPDPHVLIRLTEPINCTRIKFEFYNVKDIKNGGKYAQADGFHFLRSLEYERINYQKVGGDYSNDNYKDFHNIPEEIIKVTTNGDYTDHQIDKALDTSGDTYWQSEQPESENFRPTIFVNFTEPTFFEALIYDIKSDKGPPRKYFGFPRKVLLYTALGDDEPLTPKFLFEGDSEDPHMLFLLSQPINCTRMMFEFYYISEIKDNKGKYAQADGLHFYRSFIGEAEKFEKTGIKYSDRYYINSHKVQDNEFTYNSNGGDQTNHPLSDAFNSDTGKYWVSDIENSDEFNATIYINFTHTVLLEAMLFYATFHTDGKRQFCGFPLRLNVYSSYNDQPYELNTKFAEVPSDSWYEMQFVFPAPIRCTKLKLEFVQITNNYYSNNERKASVTTLTFISKEMIEYSNHNFTNDLDVIYANNSFYLDEVINSSFVDYSLPKENDYPFVIKRDFTFINDNFVCTSYKAGAIESKKESHILIDKCKFVSCTVKSKDENGGAINFINCGVNCGNSEFTDCTSPTAGKGGAIYISINTSISEESTIKGCIFSGCSAYYGGGAFVYSNDPERKITFNSCTFKQNKIISSESNNDQFSGSALYLMTAKSIVLRCKFVGNQGPCSLKIVYAFDNEIENIKLNSIENKNAVLIDQCLFDINYDSKSSISLVYKSNSNAPIYLNNCVFKGKLAKDAHHIQGLIENSDKFNKLQINSCKFSSDEKRALNLNSKDYSSRSFDLAKQKVDFKKQKSNDIKLIKFSLLMVSTVFMVSVIVVLIIKIKNNLNDEQ